MNSKEGRKEGGREGGRGGGGVPFCASTWLNCRLSTFFAF